MRRTLGATETQLTTLRFGIADAMGVTQDALAIELGVKLDKLRRVCKLQPRTPIELLCRLQRLLESKFGVRTTLEDLIALTRTRATAPPLPLLNRIRSAVLHWVSQEARAAADAAVLAEQQEEDHERDTIHERASSGPRSQPADLGARFD